MSILHSVSAQLQTPYGWPAPLRPFYFSAFLFSSVAGTLYLIHLLSNSWPRGDWTNLSLFVCLPLRNRWSLLHTLYTSYYKLHLSSDNCLTFFLSLKYTGNPLEAGPTASVVPRYFSRFLWNVIALGCPSTNESVRSGRSEHSQGFDRE